MIQSEISKEIKEKREKEKQILSSLIRIHGTDVLGEKNVYSGLVKIKGISFAMANAICKILAINQDKKISELSKVEIKKIEEEIENPNVPRYLKNRRNDFDSGNDKHISMTNLDLQKEFDIKRLKKIRSYRGLRHARGLPVRGQRTRSHFRKKGKNKAVGVSTKKSGKKG